MRSVGLASMRILENNEWDNWTTIEGYTPRAGDRPDVFMNSISPNYFGTLGVPVVAGREFTTQDTQEVLHNAPDNWAPTKVIINESLAKKYFSGRNPLGRHLGFGIDPRTKLDMEIIGIVKDIKYTNVRAEIPEQVFVPYLASRYLSQMTVYVRTALDADQLFAVLRARVRELDPNLPIYAMRTTEKRSKTL